MFMTPTRNYLCSARRSFWIGAAQAFDLLGLIDLHGHRALEGTEAWESDRDALAHDWQVVLGDLARSWEVLTPELVSEHERAI